VRLLDFGLSRIKSATPLTVMGTILGSPSYIAPEVWGGQPDKLDRRVDVYSLSVILFRAISGRMPFSGESLHDKFIQATTAPRPSLIAIEPDLPPEIDGWIQQALAIDPDERFATVRATWNALLSAMRYTPPRTRARIPVAESIVSAWRAAAGAFRRVIAGSGRPDPAAVEKTAPPEAAPEEGSEPPRVKLPPPPAPVRKRPRAVTAEWLLDGDVMELEERESLDPEELLREAPAVAEVATLVAAAPVPVPVPVPVPEPPAPVVQSAPVAEPVTKGRKRTRWRKRRATGDVPADQPERQPRQKKRGRGAKKKR
jgi:eukaryotic-like serine/threonine-protein kinase